MKEILVSVCCIVYNHEKYLRNALDSFLMQKTKFDFEIIIHDDASTDGSLKVALEYQEKYPDVVRVECEKENTYSKGEKILVPFAKCAKGRYLAYCEGDDYWCDENKLQKQVDVLENNTNFSACAHNTIVMNEETKKKQLLNTVEQKDSIMGVSRVLRWEKAFCFHLSSLVVCKELVKEVPLFYQCTNGFEDYPLSLLIASKGDIYYLNDSMSVYRKFTQGSWSMQNRNNFERVMKHKTSMIQMFSEFDKYSDYKYHREIKACIREQKTRITDLKKQYGYDVGVTETLSWSVWKIKNIFLAGVGKIRKILKRN